MPNLKKFVQKLLMREPFYKNGFEYQFIEVDVNQDMYNIIVNVVLPRKNQSYATPKFSYDIANILDNFSKYIGESFSYSEKILVDGKEPIKGGVFINDEKQEEVLIAIREQVKKITIKTAIGMLGYEIFWKRPDKGKFYKVDDNTYIDFYFYITISNFTLNGESVNPNLHMIDEISGIISDMMYDSDSVKGKIDDVLYIVMKNEMDISNIDDLYFQGIWYISHIDGMEVHPTSRHFDLEPEMFNKV